MSSKKKSTKSSNKSCILRCIDIKFDKKSKKDGKSATLIIKYETASGEWSQKKVFEDIYSFIESTCKSNSNKKILGHYISNMKKYKNEYLNDNKNKNAFKLIKNIFNTIGEHKKILSNDSKIISFIGAKRSHLTDIKSAQIISLNNSKSKSKPKTKRVPSIGSNTMMSSLGGGSGSGSGRQYEPVIDSDNINNNSNETEKINTSNDEIFRLKEEIESMKRKYMTDIKDIRDENHSLKQNNIGLQETNNAIIEAKEELELRVIKYEKELGVDIIDEQMLGIFIDDFKKLEDPAERYHEEVKKQKGTIDILQQQIVELSYNNNELKTKLERAKYVADHLATEVTQLTNPNIQQLEEDYREVEAELDEITKLKENYEQEMKQTAKDLDILGKEVAKMTPYYDEYPNLQKSMEKQRKQVEGLIEKINIITEEKDEFEDKYLKLKKKDKDNISKDDHQKAVKRYKEEIKELNDKYSTIETEKKEKMIEMDKIKFELGEIKMKLGSLLADNDRLARGGGRDINLEIKMDMELDNNFSIFKRDEFEYPENLSRQQLILWCEHFKLLIKEINSELCFEINNLSQRNETLENYIELKGLPFPEDIIITNDKNTNDLPHPLPYMNFMNDLETYNPSKKQLQNYIDLIFNEWRSDEIDSKNMIIQSINNNKLLNELDSNNNNNNIEKEDDNKMENNSLKKQLETAYLKQEETTLEFTKEMKELRETNLELQKQLKTEQSKNIQRKDPSEITGTLIEIKDEKEEKDKLLLNRLNDTEQYVADLEDNIKQLEFETTQQKQILEREYKHEIELINIDLEESRTQCDDLSKQIDNSDSNLICNEFRNETEDARNDNIILKKKHLSEIRDLECDRDELLREINILRIKTDRMDQNTDQQIIKMEIEFDVQNKELQHFEAVASNLSNVKEKLDVMEADRNELEKSYGLLKEKFKREKEIYLNEISQADIIKKELIFKYETAKFDIENIKKSAGIDSEKIITTTELVNMKEEMNNLKIKRDEAIKSKIKLLETSSLEIERMRNEIKILNGHMSSGNSGANGSDYRNRYNSMSSIGSSIPYNGIPHQTMLNNNNNNNNNDDGYVNSAWYYTMGMLTSIGGVFGNQNQNNNQNNNRNKKRTTRRGNEYNSSLYNMKRQSQNQHYIQPSMAGSYAPNEMGHSKGLSVDVYNAKRNRNRNRNNNHQRKISRHKSYNSQQQQQQQIHSRQSMRGHRNKQPSKQDIMLQQEENDNIKDAMTKIFNGFDIAQDNVKKQSMDISGVGSDGLNMFSLDDMIENNDNNYNNNNNNNNNEYNDEYFDNILNSGGIGGDNNDFWNNINQDDVDIDIDDNNYNQYSDDDRYGIGAMDLNTL